MQHTHTLKVPLSADAILNDYLAQQLNINLTPKQSPISLQTGYKQMPPPHSPFANLHPMTKSKKTCSPPLAGAGAATARPSYKQHSLMGQQNSLASCNDTDSDDSLQAQNESLAATSGIGQIQRKLLTFFFIYIIIIASLFFTYAVYCYHQQTIIKRHQEQQQPHQQFHDKITQTNLAPDHVLQSHALISTPDLSDNLGEETKQALDMLQVKMENKLHLLERYLEVLAFDLEDTRARLREREKCACSIECTFNGTRYADGQRWISAESKCDICSCRGGKISCGPRECPKLINASNCDTPVQLPGQCCPTCMKKCKLNKKLVSHGHIFRPTPVEGDEPIKQCKCDDGLIKCEPIDGKKRSSLAKDNNQMKQYVKLQPKQTNKPEAAATAAGVKNKTLEYLNSILGPHRQILAQNERHEAETAIARSH